MKGNPRTLAAAAAAAVLTKKRHGAAGVKRGAAFVPFFLSGEAVAVEDPLQGGFHHPAAGVRNQQKPPLHFPRRRRVGGSPAGCAPRAAVSRAAPRLGRRLAADLELVRTRGIRLFN